MGDLIYDTYIRYRNEININIKDKYLEEIIYKSIILSKSLTNFIHKKNIFTLFTIHIFYITWNSSKSRRKTKFTRIHK